MNGAILLTNDTFKRYFFGLKIYDCVTTIVCQKIACQGSCIITRGKSFKMILLWLAYIILFIFLVQLPVPLTNP